MTSIQPPLWWNGPLGPLMSRRDLGGDWFREGDARARKTVRGRHGRSPCRDRLDQTLSRDRHDQSLCRARLEDRGPRGRRVGHLVHVRSRRSALVRAGQGWPQPRGAELAPSRVRAARPPRAQWHRTLEGAVPVTTPRAGELLPPKPRAALHATLPLDSGRDAQARADSADRKSTRLNSSHSSISYAVFCLKKKNKVKKTMIIVNN